MIRKLASEKPCVILGRCADYVLNDFENHYAFFICADDSYRIKRGREVYHGKNLDELNEEDEKRARYYEYYTQRKWGDPKNYDLVLNTSQIPLEKAAEIIISYIKIKQGR